MTKIFAVWHPCQTAKRLAQKKEIMNVSMIHYTIGNQHEKREMMQHQEGEGTRVPDPGPPIILMIRRQ
jgi:hypothetical protein